MHDSIRWLYNTAVKHAELFLSGSERELLLAPIEYFERYQGGKNYLNELLVYYASRLCSMYEISILEVQKCNDLSLLLEYAILDQEICYDITVSHTENNELVHSSKVLCTYSLDLLYSMFTNGYIEDKDHTDLARYEICTRSYATCDRVRTSFKQSNLIYYIRLDRETRGKMYSISSDTGISVLDKGSTYKPVALQSMKDRTYSVICPKGLYDSVTFLVKKYLVNNVAMITYDNSSVYLTTDNVNIIKKIYGKNRAEQMINAVANNYYIVNLTASRFSTGTKELCIEKIDNISFYAENSVHSMNMQLRDGRKINFELINTNVKGAKRYMMEAIDISKLSLEKQRIALSYSDEDAYRYLIAKGVVNFKPDKSYNIKNIPFKTKEDLVNALRTNKCLIEYQSDYGVSTILCTTNTKILEDTYGKEFRVKTQMLNKRVDNLYNYYLYTKRANKVSTFLDPENLIRWGYLIDEKQERDFCRSGSSFLVFRKPISDDDLIEMLGKASLSLNRGLVTSKKDTRELVYLNNLGLNINRGVVSGILISLKVCNVISIGKVL